MTRELNLANIQGNILAGFNKDHQRFLFVGFGRDSDPHGWLREMSRLVASCAEVGAFNALFKQVNARRGGELGVVEATWTNVAITASGLARLGVPRAELEAFPDDYRAGMAARADIIGDRGLSAPAHWVAPLGSHAIHAIVLLAADDLDDLEEAAWSETNRLIDHGLRILFVQEGRARGDLPGHEHFGFKDGISQPATRGFTPAGGRDRTGQELLWPGEFVLGYPRDPDELAPEALLAPDEPGPLALSGPAWTADGSFLVFRRLHQDVEAFATFVSRTANATGRSEALVAAELVGRYKTGCPLACADGHVPASGHGQPERLLANPSLGCAEPRDDFDYASDPQGALVPPTAHVRAMNPRGGDADAPRRRILRRGIAYGEPYDPGAPASSPRGGHAAFPDDRGLLFLSYQASIERQFEHLQRRTQGLDRFVVMTGGEYFFAPSISALRDLGAAAHRTDEHVEPRRRARRLSSPSALGLPRRLRGLRPGSPSRARARRGRGRPGSRGRRGGAR